MYNLVLDRCHVLPVGGAAGEVPCAMRFHLRSAFLARQPLPVCDRCVTLGHGILGDVVGHEYWGTGAVISDLRRRDGWARGFVEL